MSRFTDSSAEASTAALYARCGAWPAEPARRLCGLSAKKKRHADRARSTHRWATGVLRRCAVPPARTS